MKAEEKKRREEVSSDLFRKRNKNQAFSLQQQSHFNLCISKESTYRDS